MKPVVAHYKLFYLALTETWIYSQIVHLKQFLPIVITQRKENFESFPVNGIYSLEDDKGYIGIYFNKGFRKLLGFHPYFYQVLKKEKTVLLHTHFGDGGYLMIPLKTKLNIPMVTTFYGFDLSLLPKNTPVWRKRYKVLFQEGELFLVEGNHMKNTLVELGCSEKKVNVQHLGVDLEQIEFIPRRIKSDGKVKILVAGSFKEKKGIPYALEAFARTKQIYKNIELTLIGDSGGTPREESEKKKIMSVIEKYALDGSVKMLGFQPYSVFLKEVKKHHIFLSTSVHSSDGDTEGGAPVSIIEASASGMPILSTFHCDIPEVVKDGESGFLARERDVNALTEKLEYLVTHQEIWESMGLAGRKHIEEEYNVLKQVERLEGIYKNLAT